METIIKRAIEGGWNYLNCPLRMTEGSPHEMTSDIHQSDCVCDPRFWQSLKDWRMWAVCLTCGTKVPMFRECNCDEDEDTKPEVQMAWEWYWHKFIHVLSNEGWDKAVAYLEEVTK